jgi:transposase-like protein
MTDLRLLKWARHSKAKKAAVRMYCGDGPALKLATELRVSRSAIHRARRELRKHVHTLEEQSKGLNVLWSQFHSTAQH